MIRTQVYIPDEQYKELKLMVTMGYGTFSELIREGVDKIIRKKNKLNKFKKFDAVKDFGNLLKGGDKDLSSKIDYYLYEEPYKNK